MFTPQRTISDRHGVLPICINSRRITQKFTSKQSTLHNVNENDRNNSFSSRKVPVILIFVASSEQSVNKNGGYWAKHWCLADAWAMADDLKRNPDILDVKLHERERNVIKTDVPNTWACLSSKITFNWWLKFEYFQQKCMFCKTRVDHAVAGRKRVEL